ncbi:DUF3578 domain-containing protein [Akkermansia sp.]|uniref:MrcB family domain-containing protein n=1 Tax=Akkermansia sp. TaxID=1872421 RepID=UPI0025C0F37C|nr:DUF3578 domain-containing protein [Akkermansia sp.]MCC8147618.1 DUF3578 domain-containing protein [Akkermansia sp.]
MRKLLESIHTWMQDYLESSKSNQIKNHSIGNLVRSKIPNQIKELIHIKYQNFIFLGSIGQGKWADIPWVAILNPIATKSPQDGIYIVYLLDSQTKKLYLSLNQGVTCFSGKNKSQKLLRRSKALRQLLNQKELADLRNEPLSLTSRSSSKKPDYYANASITAKEYSLKDIDNLKDEQFLEDLIRFLCLYDKLLIEMADNNMSYSSNNEFLYEEGEAYSETAPPSMIETLKFRKHVLRERNAKISNWVKQQRGYKCEVCGIKLEERYGDIGKDYIEAHHLRPVAERKNASEEVTKEDFVVLCPNCHKMIHKSSEFIYNFNKFKNNYINI